MKPFQKHTDCGYGYKVVCCYNDKHSRPIRVYRGENAVYKFIEKMFEEVKYCQDVMKNYFNQPMKLTRQEEENYQKATDCHICGFKIDAPTPTPTESVAKGVPINIHYKVRDHCHVTGKY